MRFVCIIDVHNEHDRGQKVRDDDLVRFDPCLVHGEPPKDESTREQRYPRNRELPHEDVLEKQPCADEQQDLQERLCGGARHSVHSISPQNARSLWSSLSASTGMTYASIHELSTELRERTLSVSAVVDVQMMRAMGF